MHKTIRISQAIGAIAGFQRAQLGISEQVSQPFASQGDWATARDSQPDSLFLLDSSGTVWTSTDKTPQFAGFLCASCTLLCSEKHSLAATVKHTLSRLLTALT